MYQWKAAGAPIPGATASYTPIVADAGKRITVVVTGSESAYDTAKATSAATAKVAS